MKIIRYGHRLRVLLAAVLLALGVVGASAATTSSSASAATGMWVCVEINGAVECVWVPLAVNWNDWLCPGCPPDFSLKNDYLTNPELEQVVAGEVAQGVSDLLVAGLATDRAARDAGFAHLERAAALAGPGFSAVRPTPDPWVGRPDPDPWVGAFELDLAEGLNLLQQAASTRDPAVASRLHDQAIGELDAAIATLEAHVTVG